MAIPGSPAFLLPPGEDEIPRKLRDIERYITELGPSIAASIKPAMDDIRAQVAATAAATAAVAAAQITLTAQGVTLTAQQATLASQVAAIAALVGAQVAVGDFNHTETGFDPVAGAWATVSLVSLTVPAGFTQAVVTAIAYAGITSAGGDIHCRAAVGGSGGPADTRSTSSGQWRPVLSMFSTRVTGLTGGGTVAVACQAYVATDVGADAANTATVSGTVLWLR